MCSAYNLKIMVFKIGWYRFFLRTSCPLFSKEKKPCLDNKRKVSTSYKSSNSLNSFLPCTLCCVMLTDLGNFSGRTRSAVSVREGQGVVLMCSPPPHSPGTVGSHSVLLLLFTICSFFQTVYWLGNIPGEMCMVFLKFIRVPDE